MQEQLISFETAKLAKEKGFDIECSLFYSDKNRPPMKYNISAKESLSNNPQYNKYILAPTQSLLQKWLREVYGIVVFVAPVIPDLNEFGCTVYSNIYNCEIDSCFGETYEEALEYGLYEGLKLIL